MSLPTAAQLRKAADLSEKIEKLQAELAALLGEEAVMPLKRGRPAKQEKAAKKTKRTMSPEARERIAAAQRKRWAASKIVAKKEAAAK